MRTKLREGERKILETRLHWATNIKPFFVLLFTATLFILSMIFAIKKNIFCQFAHWATGILFALASAYFGCREWFRRMDIWAVTNLRVIDEKGIFNHYLNEIPLEKINKFSYHQSLLGRIFNYGDVEIQTAAENGATIYRKVKNPILLKDTIAQYRDEYSKELMRIKGKNEDKLQEQNLAKETYLCPFCAETIKVKAKVCRFCGRELLSDDSS